MVNNLFLIVLDSCRFDSFERANIRHLGALGSLQRRYSYASWTSPSHYVLMMGLLPHTSPQHVFASEVYKQEYRAWVQRLGIAELSFKTFVPQLSLPKVLKDHGYKTIGRVSMPVLNPYTAISQHFDDYRLMDNHNDFRGMIDEVAFPDAQPRFYFFNLGETHYPYMLDPNSMPRVSGVHGTVKSLRDPDGAAQTQAVADVFPAAEMQRLHHQQSRCVEYVDALMGELFDKCPANTYFVVTADHGELFGEDDYFGHGPIMHQKVFEVPLVEGMRP